MSLRRSGHLNITVFMDLTGYLTKEVEYIPWQTALACLSYIGDLLEGEPDYDYFNVSVELPPPFPPWSLLQLSAPSLVGYAYNYLPSPLLGLSYIPPQTQIFNCHRFSKNSCL